MPQPLSQIDPGNKLRLDESRPWKPRTAALSDPIAQILATWADIDAALARLLAYSVSGNHSTIAAMYASLRSDDAKLGALYAAAKASLPIEEFCLMQAVIDSCKPARTQRNIFAHHIYHNLVGRDDCVVITDPSIFFEQTIQIEHATSYSGIADSIPLISELDRSKMIVYTAQDLQFCLELASAAHFNIHRIAFCIAKHPSAAHMRPELLAQPRVQKLFDKLLTDHTT